MTPRENSSVHPNQRDADTEDHMLPRGQGPESSLVIELKHVTKVYRTGVVAVAALRGINLAINEGEYVAIIGPSGSGKSTLMHILGCLDTPSSGTFRLAGERRQRNERGCSGHSA